ncbi:LysR family transcriptional regulator [Cohnella fermenti]|nr:LysR family transcriptional regulator [Cohnella fermenti]
MERLETFIVLAECGSFTEAAKKLFCSQPTISHHIQKLEEQFAAPLFIRTGKNAQLTKQGEIFLQYARQIEQQMQQAHIAVQNSMKQESMLLSVYVSQYFANYYFDDILPKLHHQGARYRLEINAYCYEDLKQALVDRRTNWAIMPYYPDDEYIRSEFTVHTMFEDEFMLVLPPGHSLNLRKTIYTRDLQDETVLIPRSKFMVGSLQKELGRLELKVQYLQMSNFEVIKQAVKSGLGIAFLPHQALRKEIETGELAARRLPFFRYHRQNGLLLRNDTPYSLEEISFFERMRSYFSEEQPALGEIADLGGWNL